MKLKTYTEVTIDFKDLMGSSLKEYLDDFQFNDEELDEFAELRTRMNYLVENTVMGTAEDKEYGKLYEKTHDLMKNYTANIIERFIESLQTK